jgi:hypothetical protein
MLFLGIIYQAVYKTILHKNHILTSYLLEYNFISTSHNYNVKICPHLLQKPSRRVYFPVTFEQFKHTRKTLREAKISNVMLPFKIYVNANWTSVRNATMFVNIKKLNIPYIYYANINERGMTQYYNVMLLQRTECYNLEYE